MLQAQSCASAAFDRLNMTQADPEISQLLDKAKAGGPGGIMSLLQDKSLMDKVYSKMGGLGDIQAAPSPAAPSPAAAAPPRPQHEIKDLIDAARSASFVQLS